MCCKEAVTSVSCSVLYLSLHFPQSERNGTDDRTSSPPGGAVSKISSPPGGADRRTSSPPGRAVSRASSPPAGPSGTRGEYLLQTSHPPHCTRQSICVYYIYRSQRNTKLLGPNIELDRGQILPITLRQPARREARCWPIFFLTSFYTVDSSHYPGYIVCTPTNSVQHRWPPGFSTSDLFSLLELFTRLDHRLCTAMYFTTVDFVQWIFLHCVGPAIPGTGRSGEG